MRLLNDDSAGYCPPPVNGNAGIVVIGRNEGERLRRCFLSICSLGAPVVYVDSNSSDESVKTARSFNIEVVELDSGSVGRSRARNEGFARLIQMNPAVRFVQFLDGDCEVASDWISTAAQKLLAAPEIAVVCGRLRERSPGASIYNRLCEIEWDQPAGETNACGGNCMMRVSAFQSVGGFDPAVLAAEDDEICLRLRRRSWKIVRRSGYAYAQGASMHGASSERHFSRETARAWFWAFLLPLAAVGAAWPSNGFSLLLLLLYGGLLFRIYVRGRRRRLSRMDASAFAAACLISKFAEFVGLLKFYRTQLRGTPMRLIEHR